MSIDTKWHLDTNPYVDDNYASVTPDNYGTALTNQATLPEWKSEDSPTFGGFGMALYLLSRCAFTDKSSIHRTTIRRLIMLESRHQYPGYGVHKGKCMLIRLPPLHCRQHLRSHLITFIKSCFQEMMTLRSTRKPHKYTRIDLILVTAIMLLSGCKGVSTNERNTALNPPTHSNINTSSSINLQLIIQNPSTIAFTKHGTIYIFATILFNPLNNQTINIQPFNSLGYDGSIDGVPVQISPVGEVFNSGSNYIKYSITIQPQHPQIFPVLLATSFGDLDNTPAGLSDKQFSILKLRYNYGGLTSNEATIKVQLHFIFSNSTRVK